MKINFHPNFGKSYKKRIEPHSALVKRVRARIQLFTQNPKNPILKDHQLKGGKIGYRAFSITGDVRIVYRPNSENKVTFYDIGTHNQVY